MSDSFESNPCLIDWIQWSMQIGLEFADRLDEIYDMDEGSLLQLHDRQEMVSDQIFGPIQESVLKEDLLC